MKAKWVREMNKFYIYENIPRKYYEYYKVDNGLKPVRISNGEKKELLNNIIEQEIDNVYDKDTYMELVFQNFSLLIDNLKIFYTHHDEDDQYFKILFHKLKRFLAYKATPSSVEQASIREYKKTLPPNHIPKVNRAKKSQLPTKQILMVLSCSVLLSILGGIAKKELDEEQKAELNLPPNPSPITQVMPQELANSTISYEIPDNTINLSFPDRTESNRVSEEMSKLEETVYYYGAIISQYAVRYGLPADLICAQITQERPNIENGVCHNICQITYEYFVGQTMVVPVYDENGFTGNYDTFEVTKEMLDSPEGNIRVGIAYLRKCVDKFQSLTTGLFSYNQGESSLYFACDYFSVDVNNYLGEENALKARDLINRYYDSMGKNHGDASYLENVFSYLDLSDRGSKILEYYLGNEKKSVAINNVLGYNNELAR